MSEETTLQKVQKIEEEASFPEKQGVDSQDTTETTLEKVTKIVMEQLGMDASKVKPEASFVEDLGADSLDTVELVMALEEAFDIEIPDEVAETIDTVGKAVEHINEKVKAPAL